MRDNRDNVLTKQASSHHKRFWDNPPPGADFFKPHTYLMVPAVTGDRRKASKKGLTSSPP